MPLASPGEELEQAAIDPACVCVRVASTDRAPRRLHEDGAAALTHHLALLLRAPLVPERRSLLAAEDHLWCHGIIRYVRHIRG